MNRSRASIGTCPANGSAVAPRTLPGVGGKGAYFTRGSGHNKFGAYKIPDEYQEVMDRLLRKHKEAAASFHRRLSKGALMKDATPARVGIITVGGCDAAVREAIDILAAQGIPMDYMRIRAFPFDKARPRPSSPSTTSVTWWSRIAMLSFDHC